jgi:hypothetical protein
MSVVMKTKNWQIEPYNGGFGVFDSNDRRGADAGACIRCVEEALAGDLEAVLAVEMCKKYDEQLMNYWNEQLKEKAECKPKA